MWRAKTTLHSRACMSKGMLYLWPYTTHTSSSSLCCRLVQVARRRRRRCRRRRCRFFVCTFPTARTRQRIRSYEPNPSPQLAVSLYTHMYTCMYYAVYMHISAPSTQTTTIKRDTTIGWQRVLSWETLTGSSECDGMNRTAAAAQCSRPYNKLSGVVRAARKRVHSI